MEEVTTEVGLTIRWMGLEFSHGLMEKTIEESIRTTSSMVKGLLYGQTEKSTKECGGKECSMVKE